MKITRTLLLSWSMKVIVFLLRGAGWAAIGIFVGFVVSYFFRFSGRVDVFAFTESMLGIIVTGLAIVGAFIVALQWSNLDSRIHIFDTEMKETKTEVKDMLKILEDTSNLMVEKLKKDIDKNNSRFDKYSDWVIKTLNDIDSYIKFFKDEHSDLMTGINRVSSEYSDLKISLKYVSDEFSNIKTSLEDSSKQKGLAEGEEG